MIAIRLSTSRPTCHSVVRIGRHKVRILNHNYNGNITMMYMISYHNVEYIDSIRLFAILDILRSHIFLIVDILTLYYKNR